jgi:uncharacterized SAM-binding protein YcdF (DUF218 family)
MEGGKVSDRIIRDITDFIFISDTPRSVDVLLLPGGSDPAIPEKAAELYANGFAPFIVPSGGVSVKSGKFAGVKRKIEVYSGDYKTDCAFYTDVLIKNGVPITAILCEDKSGYTKENAILSRKVLDERGIAVNSAIVVCKSFHARRSLMCYQFAFPEAEVFIVPVEVYDISSGNWHTSEYGIERVLGELTRCGNQFTDEFQNLRGENYEC